MKFVIHVNTLITDEQNQILLVNEKKELISNKLNLPGGHLEIGEELAAGAKREAIEEINVEIKLLGLIGIYTGRGNDHYINFIFAGKILKGKPIANKDEINGFGWYSVDEILNLPDDKILNPKKLKKVVVAYRLGRLSLLDTIEESVYPN